MVIIAKFLKAKTNVFKLFFIIILLLSFFTIANKFSDKEKALALFAQSVKKHDLKQLKDMLASADEKLEINEENVKQLVIYLNENERLTNVLEMLKKDDKHDLISIKEEIKWGIFKDYIFVIQPYYVDLSIGKGIEKISLSNGSVFLKDSNNDYWTVEDIPVIPGKHTVIASFETDLINFEDKFIINIFNRTDNHKRIWGKSIYLHTKSSLPDVTYIVNGKKFHSETGSFNLHPIPFDGSVTVKAEKKISWLNNIKLQSNELTITKDTDQQQVLEAMSLHLKDEGINKQLYEFLREDYKYKIYLNKWTPKLLSYRLSEHELSLEQSHIPVWLGVDEVWELLNLPHVQSNLIKSLFDKDKEVVKETKIISSNELSVMLDQQAELAQRLFDSNIYSLVGVEVRRGLERAADTLYLIDSHPEYKFVEVEVPVTKYQDNNETIEFISDEGTIKKVLENGVWKDYMTSTETFYEVKSDWEILLHKSEKIFKNLSELNWSELSREVHPWKGLTFSLFAGILGHPQSVDLDLTFTKSEVEKFKFDDQVYTWGYDDSGRFFDYTANEYVEKILLRPRTDYTSITYNNARKKGEGRVNRFLKYYPEAVYIEYYSPPYEYSIYSWQSLRFFYDKVGNEWYLFAIVRDVWSP